MLVSLIWARNWAFFNKLCKAGHFFAPKIVMTSLPRDHYKLYFTSFQVKNFKSRVHFQGHGQQGHSAQFVNRHRAQS